MSSNFSVRKILHLLNQSLIGNASATVKNAVGQKALLGIHPCD